MAPGRPTRANRLVSNENDENTGSSRLTRAKAASLNTDELALPSKALQTKKPAAAAATAQRKRAALGDVSNVTKVEVADGGKKAVGAKAGLVSKAAQPTGIQKSSARPATTSRTALASKEANKKIEVKRSGPGAIPAQKRKAVSSSVAVKQEAPAEGEPVRKKLHVLESTTAAATNKPKAKPVVKKEEDVERKVAPPVAPEPPAVEEEIDTRPEAVKEMDREDLDDPLMVAEYADDIFRYLGEIEPRYMPNPQYMAHQDDLEWKTRGILIDWLVEVHTRFHLVPETLFLAVNIVDRFLSEKVVQLDRLQLVGITAMFIASKYEEVMSPHVTNFKHVTDDGFTEAEILSAERFILATLNYDLSYPNPMNFLRRISKADDYFVHTRTIGKYLMEISLLDHRFMEYPPSLVAAAAMGLARLILDRGEWDEILTHYSGYDELEIEPVIHLMIDYLARPIVHEAFFKKYASKKFFKTSILTRNWAVDNAEYYGIGHLVNESLDLLE